MAILIVEAFEVLLLKNEVLCTCYDILSNYLFIKSIFLIFSLITSSLPLMHCLCVFILFIILMCELLLSSILNNIFLKSEKGKLYPFEDLKVELNIFFRKQFIFSFNIPNYFQNEIYLFFFSECPVNNS